jgi:hypothetical protein
MCASLFLRYETRPLEKKSENLAFDIEIKVNKKTPENMNIIRKENAIFFSFIPVFPQSAFYRPAYIIMKLTKD